MPKTTEELVNAVRAHASSNYESDGWDYLVECYDYAEIVELIDDALTVEGAIATAGKVLKAMDDHRKEIEATAF